MRISVAIALLGVGLCGSQVANAGDDFWIGAKAGTLGLGLEATWRPVPYLDLRAGVNRYTYDSSTTENDIEYDTELDLDSLYATANLRVPLSPFRVTAGVFANGNELALMSKLATSYDIGGTTYTPAEVGTLRSAVDFESTAPYLGLGFDFRILDTVGFNIDLGVLWQGSPNVGLTADGLLASDPTFMADLETERQDLEDDVDKFKAYPVASIGFSVNF